MVLVNGKKGLVDVRHSHNRIRLPEKKILLTMYLCNRLNTYLGQTLVHLESETTSTLPQSLVLEMM